MIAFIGYKNKFGNIPADSLKTGNISMVSTIEKKCRRFARPTRNFCFEFPVVIGGP
jgi:hypothetical protein